MLKKVGASRGFTLIELLVVIAIIGILASIVLASLDSARKKGRDARRISDIKQLQLALELYYDANSAFPPGIVGGNGKNAIDPAVLETPGYISKVPTDPSSGSAYLYTPYGASATLGTCTSYHIATTLETVNHSALTQDSDLTTFPSGYSICSAGGAQPATDFNGLSTGANCGGAVGSASPGTETCYDLRP